MKRNFTVKITLAIMLIHTLTACGIFQPAQKANSPLRFEFTQWWGDYTLLVAQEKGFFEKYGVQVEPTYYEIFSDTYPDLAAGQIDGALIAVGDTINISRDTPMKVVAVNDDGGDDAVLASPEINSILDLKGKAIGLLSGSQYELTVVEMLRTVNMDFGDVTIVSINPEDSLAALESDQVQAVSTWEPYMSEALASGYKMIYPKEQQHLFPDLIVFRKAVVDSRPEDIRAFLKAWFEAVEYRKQNPEETIQIAAKYTGLNVEDILPDENLGIYSLKDNQDLFDIQKNGSIYSIAKTTTDYLITNGTLTKQIDTLELLDPSYLP